MHLRHRLRLALLLGALCLSPTSALALAPDHAWRTLETPHFVLHFHEGLYPLAVRAARSLEQAHERMVPLLEAAPRRKTQVVLSDDTDDANGAAIAFERPRIWLQAAPPDDLSVLGDYDDYVFLLVGHEYVHVLHLGTVSGLSSWLNVIFGDRWVPNSVLPRFFTEGLAVYHETQLSTAGRNRSALFDMYLRTDVLGDRLLPLSQLTSGTLRWPRGNAAYLYGGRFLAYLAETRGDEALRAFIHEYGRNLVPYSMNLDLHTAAGIDFHQLWDEWARSLRDRYREQEAIVREAGPLTEPALRSRFGDGTGAPRWKADGSGLYYVEATAHRLPRLRLIERETGADHSIRELGGAGTLAVLGGDAGVILSRAEVFEAYRVHGELFLVSEDGERQLTSGLRASEPDLSPDGEWIYFVERRAGRTALLRLRRDAPGVAPELVYEPARERELYTPRVSPDGRWVALSLSRPGPGRDLVLVPADPSGGAAVQPLPITDDDAIDLDPTWTPDGSALIFSSDRSGIFNLYSIPIVGSDRPLRASERIAPQKRGAILPHALRAQGSFSLASPPASRTLTRLTNVLTGAFQPDVSPDGSWIAWTTYGPEGFDVAAAPLASLTPAPAPPFVSDRPAPSTVGRDDRIYPVRPYDPLETLGPQSWFPYLGSDLEGTIVGATMAGTDVVGRHAWALSAGYGLTSRQPEAAASYQYAGWYLQPTLTAGTVFRQVPGWSAGTTERLHTGSAGLELPIRSTRRSHSVGLAYQATFYQPLDSTGQDRGPAPGVATELQLRWQFSSAERPSQSISPEDGVATGVLGRVGSRALGGDFDYAALDATASAYLRMPYTQHHVLALTGRVGLSRGDLGIRRLYGLGGPVLRDPLVDLLYTGSILGSGILRGYAPFSFVGSSLALGSLEYRFPIAWIDRSPGTLPLYAGKLAGALFAEAGSAFSGGWLPRLHPSVGGELRLGVDVGWGFAGSIRLGYAYGLDVAEGGGSHPYLGIGATF